MAARLGQRQADEPPAVLGHEVHVLRRAVARGEDKIAFVLAVLVIHDDDHLARADILDYFLD